MSKANLIIVIVYDDEEMEANGSAMKTMKILQSWTNLPA